MWFICTITHLLFAALVLKICWTINYVLWILAIACILKVSFSLKLLIDIALNVVKYLEKEPNKARFWAQQLVRRNVYKLDEAHVLSATIESLAESICDGFISPLFYYPFFGPLAPLLQRIANALDSSVGYKAPPFKDVGWFSAKADTIINYIPARLTAIYIILSSAILKYNWREALKVYLRDRCKTESLNAGHPMAAIAGSLEIKLEKIGFYTIGRGAKEIEANDVRKAINIIKVVALLHLTFLIFLILTLNALVSCLWPITSLP